MKRIVGFLLTLIILISFVPMVGQGASYFKDVDVIFGNFKLNVNGKRIVNHKEPFLYDGNFYVSLSDLARGLEIDMSTIGNTVYLDSNEKLNIDSYTSKLPLVFQRGYEVLAKEKLIEELEEEVRALEGKKPLWIKYEMKASMKNIRVGFGNISIYLDGKKIKLDKEPFKYNKDIYVALDSIAPYLYITPDFSRDKTTINIDTNGILASNNPNSIDYSLKMLNGRNYLLDIQKAALEKRKEVFKALNIPYKKIDTISSLKRFVNSNFNKISDLTVSIDLSKVSDWIYIDIYFPTSRNHLWTSLNRVDVEEWIWNIYTAILNLYDEDAQINGIIRNPYYSQNSTSSYRNYVTFYSRDNDIHFNFTNSRLNIDTRINPVHLMEVLNSSLNKYNNLNFSYEAEMAGDNLELRISPTTDTLSKSSIYTKMGYLKSLNQKLRTLYPSINIYGQIIYPGDVDPFNFYISENKIRSKDLLDESTEYINNSYGFFSTGSYGYRLKYSIYEVDLMNFHLVAETDFSIQDDRWVYGGEAAFERLNSTVHNAVSTIASLWDANLTVDIVDKDGIAISEYVLHQEAVSIVTAEPGSGLVPEGQRVYLYTATPGATIYYTTDGSTPTEASFIYDGRGLLIVRDMVIKAVAYKEGLKPSPVSTFNYTIDETGGLSQGLIDLYIDEGSLNPPFSQDTFEYVVNVDNDISSVYITPYAEAGTIRINGNIVISGVSRQVALGKETTIVTIEVKEENKIEKVYKVIINKAPSAEDVYTIENLVFNTSFNVFSGRLANPSVTDFSSYKVRLLTQSNVTKATGNLGKDGSFSLTNFELDWFDKLFGVKYEILDGTGKVVYSGNLN